MAYLEDDSRPFWYAAALVILSLLFAALAFLWWVGLASLIECLPTGTAASAACESEKHWTAILLPVGAVLFYVGVRWLERRQMGLGLAILGVVVALATYPLVLIL